MSEECECGWRALGFRRRLLLERCCWAAGAGATTQPTDPERILDRRSAFAPFTRPPPPARRSFAISTSRPFHRHPSPPPSLPLLTFPFNRRPKRPALSLHPHLHPRPPPPPHPSGLPSPGAISRRRRAAACPFHLPHHHLLSTRCDPRTPASSCLLTRHLLAAQLRFSAASLLVRNLEPPLLPARRHGTPTAASACPNGTPLRLGTYSLVCTHGHPAGVRLPPPRLARHRHGQAASQISQRTSPLLQASAWLLTSPSLRLQRRPPLSRRKPTWPHHERVRLLPLHPHLGTANAIRLHHPFQSCSPPPHQQQHRLARLHLHLQLLLLAQLSGAHRRYWRSSETLHRKCIPAPPPRRLGRSKMVGRLVVSAYIRSAVPGAPAAAAASHQRPHTFSLAVRPPLSRSRCWLHRAQHESLILPGSPSQQAGTPRCQCFINCATFVQHTRRTRSAGRSAAPLEPAHPPRTQVSHHIRQQSRGSISRRPRFVSSSTPNAPLPQPRFSHLHAGKAARASVHSLGRCRSFILRPGHIRRSARQDLFQFSIKASRHSQRSASVPSHTILCVRRCKHRPFHHFQTTHPGRVVQAGHDRTRRRESKNLPSYNRTTSASRHSGFFVSTSRTFPRPRSAQLQLHL